MKRLNGLVMLNLVHGYIGACNVNLKLVIGMAAVRMKRVASFISGIRSTMDTSWNLVLRTQLMNGKLRNGTWRGRQFPLRKLAFDTLPLRATTMIIRIRGIANINYGILLIRVLSEMHRVNGRKWFVKINRFLALVLIFFTSGYGTKSYKELIRKVYM